jgi:AcrR family transcriptional regulator
MTPATATKGPRRSAEERRAEVVRAGIEEFAERGYHAASTAAIAHRAGISQPYIYALFPNKRELFLACHQAVNERIVATFREAAKGASDPDDALQRMGQAYTPLIEDHRADLLFQMQGYATASDPEIGPVAAQGFKDVAAEIRRASGATPEQAATFLACGMLINVTTALGVPEVAAPIMQD